MWLDDIVQHTHDKLTGGRELEALWERGVTDAQIQEYQIGYLDDRALLPSVPAEFRAWFEFNCNKLFDSFVFPLTNALGQVKGLQFRRVERSVKGYLDYYAAKDEPAYFGLSQAMPHVWRTQTICLVEGAFDLMPVQRVFPNSVTTMTSSVSTAFFRFLRRNAKSIWFLYDMDAAGKKGVWEFLESYKSEFCKVLHPQLPRVKMVTGKTAKDPGELWECLGDQQFATRLRALFA